MTKGNKEIGERPRLSHEKLKGPSKALERGREGAIAGL